MEELRLQKEEEKNTFEIRFKFPILLLIIFILLGIAMYAVGFVIGVTTGWPNALGPVLLGCGSLFIIAAGIVLAIYYKMGKCVFSDRRITGKIRFPFGYKEYSLKLDQITDVKISSFLGIKTLTVRFKQGDIFNKRPHKLLVLSFVYNAKEAYEYLANATRDINNDVDVLMSLLKK